MAASAAEGIVEQHPRAFGGWQLLGVARLSLGDAAGAEPALQRAVQLAKDNAVAWELLGVALQRLGRPDEAAAALERSLALRPASPSGWANAAAVACERRRFDEAMHCARRALALDPRLASAHVSVGNALLATGRADAALMSFQQALSAAPGLAEALTGAGNALVQLEREAEALPLLEQAVKLQPASAVACVQLAAALARLGRMPEAIERYRAAIALDRSNPLLWSGYLYALTHADGVDPGAVFAAHVEFGELIEAPWRDQPRKWSNLPDPDRPLRLGFVSADLRDHPVAYFVEPSWARFDPKQFELHAYHSYPAEDAVSDRLRTRVKAWHRVHDWSDEALAERIRADGIDILFDLSGHTAGTRLGVFARKPAPLQVTWIGYPGTTGLQAMDYRIVNLMSAEGGVDRHFVEKLIRCGVGTCFEPPDVLPPLSPLPALARGHVTFGSFNRPVKITSQSVALWCRVLNAVPDARMLIGAVGDGATQARLTELFVANGVDAARLDFRPRVSLDAYLALHSEVDFLLDTLPYSGGTTTSHALWLGVPTLSRVGEGQQQSHAKWRLVQAGLDDWAVYDDDEFVERAVAASRDMPALAAVRAGLRARMEAARERERISPDLPRALRIIWQRWCGGLAPEALIVRSGGEQ